MKRCTRGLLDKVFLVASYLPSRWICCATLEPIFAKSGYITTSADYWTGKSSYREARTSLVDLNFARGIGAGRKTAAPKDGIDCVALYGRISCLSLLGQNSNKVARRPLSIAFDSVDSIPTLVSVYKMEVLEADRVTFRALSAIYGFPVAIGPSDGLNFVSSTVCVCNLLA